MGGVWTVRALAGRNPGTAWGIACLGVGLRWGSVGLADIGTATRLTAQTVASGPLAVKVGVALALAGALADPSHAAGLGSRGWGERLASGGAIVAIVPLFLVRGMTDPHRGTLWWGLFAAAGAALALAAGRLTELMPTWVPLALAVAGVGLIAIAS